MSADVTCADSRFFTYKEKTYPDFIRNWRAGRFVFEFATEFCQGEGLDIGGDAERLCVYPGARAINIDIDDEYDAMHLPDGEYDYIFSSMTLEHLDKPVDALKLWYDVLKPGGTLFLYLPHPDMRYWRPGNCARHKFIWYPEIISEIVADIGFENVIHSLRDLYWGYCVVGVKPKEEKAEDRGELKETTEGLGCLASLT
jgi:SAM-dependent methyltransferase